MFRSIATDIKSNFDYGNMIIKLVIINVGVFVLTALINAFFPAGYHTYILPYLALPGDVELLIYRPWTIITYMFLHDGIWHLAGNMITLYWFGNITGDLLGDKRILPLYLIGGIIGAFFYVLSYNAFSGIGYYALGASAATLTILFTAVATAPDYIVHLLLLGEIRIKFIGLFILFLDVIGTQGNINSGGHFAHLGGCFFGILFVYLLRKGTDLTAPFINIREKLKRGKKQPKNSRSVLKVAHRSPEFGQQQLQAKNTSTKSDISVRVDEILDKIKQKGYDSLTDEEKEVLYQASKN